MTAYAVLSTASRASGLDLSAALTTPGGTTGDTFPAGSDIYLRLKTAGTALTASVIDAASVSGPSGTFLAPYTVGGGALAATGDKIFGPWPANVFASPADGLVHVNYTVVTTLTVGVYRLTNN